MRTGELYMVQEDGSRPTILVHRHVPGEGGVCVVVRGDNSAASCHEGSWSSLLLLVFRRSDQAPCGIPAYHGLPGHEALLPIGCSFSRRLSDKGFKDHQG
jgi:hypothetical protein